jgi:hypothetical protein
VFKAAIAIKTLEKYDHQQASEQAKHCWWEFQCFYDVHDCQSHESLISVANCNPIVICN